MHCISNVWKSSGTLEAVYVLQFIIECMQHRHHHRHRHRLRHRQILIYFFSFSPLIAHRFHSSYWIIYLQIERVQVKCPPEIWPSQDIECTLYNSKQHSLAHAYVRAHTDTRKQNTSPLARWIRCRRLEICNRVRLHVH